MKGLILKDLYAVRGLILLVEVILLFPCVGMFLVGGGMFSEFTGTPNAFIGVIPFALLYFCNIVVASSVTLEMLSSDENSGWGRLQIAMPVSRRQIVASRYIAAFTVVGITTVLSLLVGVLAIAIFGLPVELMLTIPLCLAFFETAVLSATIAVCYRYGAKISTFVYYGFVIVITALMILLLMLSLELMKFVWLRLVFYLGVPVVSAAVVYFSYASAARSLQAET